MSKKQIFLSVTNGFWLIEANAAEQYGPQVARLLSGDKFFDEESEQKEPEFTIIEPQNAGSYMSSSLSSAKPGSIAVVSIEGPIMKYDNCGDPGTQTYERMIAQASANPNISGIILMIDSPGGTVAGTQSLANVIKGVEKPVVTLADDLMASAAYWIGSQSDFIFANTGTTRIGSIGTMLSFADVQPYWEKQGIKFHEIYADASHEKNASFAQARESKYAAIKAEMLNPLNDQFVNSVKSARKNVADTALHGKVFVADEAIKQGLIDAIGNLNDAVDKIQELNSGASAADKTILQESQMKTITLTAAHAALIALFGATLAEGQQSVDVELNDENIAKLNATIEASTQKDATIAEKDQQVNTLTQELATEKTAHQSTKAEFDAFKTENPGTTTSKTKGLDELTSSKEDFLSDVDARVSQARKEAGLE